MAPVITIELTLVFLRIDWQAMIGTAQARKIPSVAECVARVSKGVPSAKQMTWNWGRPLRKHVVPETLRWGLFLLFFTIILLSVDRLKPPPGLVSAFKFVPRLGDSQGTWAIFFVPSNPNAPTALATITDRLHTSLADDPVPIGRWALEHKLMRDTPSCLPASASRAALVPRYMQFLSLSYHQNHGFIYTSVPENSNASATGQGISAQTPTPAQGAVGSPGAGQPQQQPMIMTTVPLPSSGTLFQHFMYAAQPLWCHRHSVTVPGGAVYDVGDYRVRVGDVRQTVPTARVRGAVVEIEWRGPSLVRSIAMQMQKAKASSAEARMGGHAAAASGQRGSDSGNDSDSAIELLFAEGIEEADIDADYVATTALIREFWAKLGIEGAREAILLPDVGKEVKGMLRKLKQGRPVSSHGEKDEDPDPEAGVDVARQFMEIFRFNR
ncbi:uncharacterized protein KD926_011518 [Aspergillus affinis]|uniref:uncharacterized protein n=1 Tax=Aspergillus affinis TaxID=1070780 RepID=UPI0022FDB941|nr:uncharacterized protein KD926_011518 [Aspergillus affinis]KAI9037906.1 hypothetical protein KD926_011518 [Aspergillus affinis]